MRLGPIEIKRRAAVAAIGIVLATSGWFFRARRGLTESIPPPVAPTPVLKLTGRAAGDLLREQAEYFDPTPLFFPTPHNFGQGRVVGALQREPSEGFGDFPPSLRFQGKLPAFGLLQDLAPQKPEELLTFNDEDPFAGFGRAEVPVANLKERSAHVEVKALMDGRIVFGQDLVSLALPKAEFMPLEFLVLVGSNGVIGEPLLTANSGSEQVDAFFREYLVKSFRLGERLEPGKYAVTVGP